MEEQRHLEDSALHGGGENSSKSCRVLHSVLGKLAPRGGLVGCFTDHFFSYLPLPDSYHAIGEYARKRHPNSPTVHKRFKVTQVQSIWRFACFPGQSKTEKSDKHLEIQTMSYCSPRSQRHTGL